MEKISRDEPIKDMTIDEIINLLADVKVQLNEITEMVDLIGLELTQNIAKKLKGK